MNSLTVSAHLKPDTETLIRVFDDVSDPFVSLRIGGPDVDVALLVSPGSAPALRALAHAANEAAQALEHMVKGGAA